LLELKPLLIPSIGEHRRQPFPSTISPSLTSPSLPSSCRSFYDHRQPPHWLDDDVFA
jgi:hypothetical protein